MSNNAIQIFKNEEFGEVRTVFENDDVWFIARDVATILGYKNQRTLSQIMWMMRTKPVP